MDPLLQQVSVNIQRRRLLPDDATVVVGVSGGLDSVVLLDVLRRLSSERGWKLVVAHANHELRGRASDADERFVQSLAAAFALPFRSTALGVRLAAAASGESIEMAARRLRHKFLARVQRQRLAAAIALAHHADDQVELFFLRLFRGAGGDGLGGMTWSAPSPAAKEGRVIRPLLNVRRLDLERYARDHDLRWREDASNQDRSILRNRIRHELLPLIERDYCPGLRAVVPRCMDILRADAEFVRGEARRRLDASLTSLAGLPLALQRALARDSLAALGRPASFEAVEGFLDKQENGASWNLTPGTMGPSPALAPRFQSSRRRIVLGSEAGSAELSGSRVQWRWRRRALPWSAQRDGSEQFDADQVGSAVTLRHWRPGDRFQPLGFPTPAKLQDIFVNRKVQVAERRRRLLATDGSGRIFWVEGLPPGEAFKVRAETRRILVWRVTTSAGSQSSGAAVARTVRPGGASRTRSARGIAPLTSRKPRGSPR